MEYLFLTLLIFVCVAFLLIIRSKNNYIKKIESESLRQRLVYNNSIDYNKFLIGEIKNYKERIKYLFKELGKDPDELLFKIESPGKESRISKERPSNPEEVITIIYEGYKVEPYVLDSTISTPEAIEELITGTIINRKGIAEWEQKINQINCQ